jgi:glycosyltransferase involved in cell wall biosynthesis
MRASRTRDADVILLDASVQEVAAARPRALQLDDVVSLGLGEVLRRHALRYRRVCIRTHEIDLIRKPFNKAALLRLMCSGQCWFEDEQGARREITLAMLARLGYRRLRAAYIARRGRRQLLERIEQVGKVAVPDKRYGSGGPLYLRTDLVFGLQSGGSVTHIAGVLNQLHKQFDGVRFVTTDVIPTVADGIEPLIVRPDPRLWDVPESNAMLMNLPLRQQLYKILADEAPRFVYQRYSVNNCAGLLIAEELSVPFVLEYNGSEIWINRHWGRVLHDEETALQIERLNIARADLVVVVSQALADELVERGVKRDRILVNPNGVDPDVYRPDLDTGAIRRQYGIGDEKVVGFIGTFGPWHGTAVLVDAFALLLQARPSLVGRVRLMLIGDGQQMSGVRDAIRSAGLEDSVVLTGRVAQLEGPEHLAACDVLVSPHVGNPDGSAFFGSPTKLFEYMAMGRPIVASDLDQIGEVLRDGETALLVPPADPDALAQSILRVLDEPELAERLGARARERALAKHTWRRHTPQILARLDELMGTQHG